MARTMQFLESSGRIVLVLFNAMFLAVVFCAAQEVASVDLTNITPRVEFLPPPPHAGDASVHGGTMSTWDYCDASEKIIGDLKSTLVSLDRTEYRVGDQPRFEVRIENVGGNAIRIPFSPNRSEVQPSDPAQKFLYYKMLLQLWVGGKRWSADTGGVIALYGDDNHSSTMITLHPGESVRIVGKGKITLPENSDEIKVADDPATHANVQTTVFQDETLLTSTASATSSKKVCFHSVQGQSLPLRVIN